MTSKFVEHIPYMIASKFESKCIVVM